MGTELPAQRLMQQVRGTVMGLDGAAPGMIHRGLHCLARARMACLQHAHMDEQPQFLLRVAHRDAQAVRAGDDARIADLAATLGIEGRLVQHDGDFSAGAGGDGLHAIDHDRDQFALRLPGAVAQEVGGADALLDVEPEAFGRGLPGAGPGGAGAGLLLGHCGVETDQIHLASLAAQGILRQVKREAVGVVEAEGDRAGQRLALPQPRRLLRQQAQAALQQPAELLLLQPQRLGDQRRGAAELGIGHAHLPLQCGEDPREQGVLRTHHVGMAHGAAQDAAQHVAAPLVARQHAIGEQETASAKMIGHDAMADAELAIRRLAGGVGAGQDQRTQRVGVVIVVHALQDGSEPLEPHAGVDGRARQRVAGAGRLLQELHEDQVPDLDEPVAILVRAAGRAAPDLVAVVEENLTARPARPGIAHPPEIVGGRDADDTAVR